MSATLRAQPRSVGAVVRAVRASRVVFLALECALLFLAGAWLARTAALLSGADGETWSVALLSGLLCAAAWWLEHPLDLAGAARVLDRRLGHAGALLTAFELEEERRTLRDMEELVRARVLARLRPAAALRVMLPAPAVPLAAPLLAAAALAFVLDARAARTPSAPALGTLAAGLERALAAGALESDPSVRAAEVAAVRAEVRALAARLAAGPGARDAVAAPTVLAALDRRVTALAAELPPASPAHGPLREARLWLDALQVELAARSAGPAATGTATGELTDAPADGTISGSFPDPAPPMTPAPVRPTAEPAPAGDVLDLGRQAGTFWPQGYDAVVERWIELSRAAHEGS